MLMLHALFDAVILPTCPGTVDVARKLLCPGEKQAVRNKSSLSKLNREILLSLHANSFIDMMDDRSRHSRFTVGAFLHNMTDIQSVYCEIWCQNCFVTAKCHFDSYFIIYFTLLQSPTLSRQSIMGTSSTSSFGKLLWSTTQWERWAQTLFFCYCLNPNQRWLPIYWGESGSAWGN